MRKQTTEKQLNIANGYCAINIEIPDNELIQEMIDIFYKAIDKITSSDKINYRHQEFLKKNLYVATSKNEVMNIFTQARNNGYEYCIVVSFNATLSQKMYNNLGVVNFKYLSWTKKAWKKVKKIYNKPVVKRLIFCLLQTLIHVSCKFLKAQFCIPC